MASHHTLGRGVGFPACIGKEGRGLHSGGEGLHPGGGGLHPEGVCIRGGRGSASRRGGSASGGSGVCIRGLRPGELGKPLPPPPKIHGILWDMVN